MPGIGPPPRGAVGAKDVSDLQRGPGHVYGALLQSASERLVLKLLQRLERADRAADRLGVNVGIDRGGIEPGMPEQDLNDTDIGVRFQEMRGEAVSQRVQRCGFAD